ncbi:MAG TPA: hypothetical protein VFP14_07155, partial [Novosphingobium sp.]|nr:hypothetical protein [Novosphingobium sp.]
VGTSGHHKSGSGQQQRALHQFLPWGFVDERLTRHCCYCKLFALATMVGTFQESRAHRKRLRGRRDDLSEFRRQ